MVKKNSSIWVIFYSKKSVYTEWKLILSITTTFLTMIWKRVNTFIQSNLLLNFPKPNFLHEGKVRKTFWPKFKNSNWVRRSKLYISLDSLMWWLNRQFAQKIHKAVTIKVIILLFFYSHISLDSKLSSIEELRTKKSDYTIFGQILESSFFKVNAFVQ